MNEQMRPAANGLKSSALVALGIGIGFAVAVIVHLAPRPASAEEEHPARPLATNVAELATAVAELQKQISPQSNGMLAVGEHYTNLWHAVQAGNWKLAEFYAEETEESIEWAVSLEPIHKNSQNEDVVLPGIWGGVKESLYEPLEATVRNKDKDGFEKAYKAMMEGCYSCHKAVEKPYLRPHVPTGKPSSIINVDPAAKWPE